MSTLTRRLLPDRSVVSDTGFGVGSDLPSGSVRTDSRRDHRRQDLVLDGGTHPK